MATDDVLCYGEGERYPRGNFVNFGRGLVHVNPDDPDFTPHYAANGKLVGKIHIPQVDAIIEPLRKARRDAEIRERGGPDAE